MNRNVESHFSELPNVDLNRSIFDRSSTHKTSFNVGELIPFYVDEVLPGDTFRVKTSKVVRMQTMLTPVMDNLYLDTYYFFVPNRLVWIHWKEFMGENTSGPWTPSVTYQIPRIVCNSNQGTGSGVQTGSIADYMGIPVGVPFAGNSSFNVSALPFRAYGLICDQWFRDENLQDPLNISTADSDSSFVSLSGDQIIGPSRGGPPFKVAKYHDYFTSCLPAPQKGPSVGLSLTGNAPVITGNTHDVSSLPGLTWYNPDNVSSLTSYNLYGTSVSSVDNTVTTFVDDGYTPTGSDPFLARPQNLWADVSNVGAVDINELRLAFQLQKFYEKNARAGTRYIEFLKSHFGVSSPDARLQRSEYLGGNRIPINVHEVTNTAQGSSDFLGDLGAMSVTSDIHDDFVHSFTEHGYVIGVCCLRYDHSYPQGLEKFWTRKNVTDFYLPVFANIGEQPVYESEIYVDSSVLSYNHVFGYQEAWADYRYKPDRVSGEMRPGISNTLASWHYADYYTSAPTLSASWIREDKTNVDRTLAVTSSNSNQAWADFYIQNICTRVMPMYSVPGLIDHH